MGLERRCSWNCFGNNNIFFLFATHFNTHFHPLQLRIIVVDEDDNGKFRLERVKLVRYHTRSNLGVWALHYLFILAYELSNRLRLLFGD